MCVTSAGFIIVDFAWTVNVWRMKIDKGWRGIGSAGRGSLSSHLFQLGKAGYIVIKKTNRGKIPLTMCTLNEKGCQAFQDYRKLIKQFCTKKRDPKTFDELYLETDMNTVAIRTDNLSRDFRAIRAVDNLSLEVPSGIVFGFLGPNGAGKTTTIRLLLGLLEPTDGSAAVLGYDVRAQADEIRLRSGALLEHNGLYERLSAEDNLSFYGRVWHMPDAERKARIKDLLTHLDLWERRGEQVGTWSRGMKQKLALARTLLHRPALIFLDEPTAGLDPVAAAAVRDDLASLGEREGVTIFLTTHNLAEAENLCHQVSVIRQGKLIALGQPDELKSQAGGPRVEVLGHGFTSEMLSAIKAWPEVSRVDQRDNRLTIYLSKAIDSAPLVTQLVSAGAQVEEVRKGKASLEEVFLTLMEENKEAEA